MDALWRSTVDVEEPIQNCREVGSKCKNNSMNDVNGRKENKENIFYVILISMNGAVKLRAMFECM